MRTLKLPTNNFIFLSIVTVTFLKVFVFILQINGVITFTTGGGSDADYYDDYAQGYVNIAANAWPIILRGLDNLGYYSREGVTYFLLLLNIVFIPLLTCKIASLSFQKNQKLYLLLFSLCAVYPTLYIFTFDIYRDVFMVFSFLIGCLAVKKMLSKNNFILFSLLFILNLFIGWFLLNLRPYLGYAFLASLLLFKIKFNKKRVFVLGFIYTLVLFLAYLTGILDNLIEYRSGFEEVEAGSTLGLDFSNPVLFLPNLILSTLGQLFGLYIVNPLAAILILVETIPFAGMIIYIIKNIQLADSFARFLIIFFILYASVWLLGNDNLGTAIRLRLYNYFVVYICFFYILKLKQLITSKNNNT